MPLGDHLQELRRRVIFALLGLFPLFCAGLYFGKSILGILVRPMIQALTHEHVGGGMMATSVLEGFTNYLKIAALLAAIVGAPWIVYQAWKFVAPGLYARERRFFYLLAPMSLLLSALGVVFMYYVMLPFVLFFFVKFNDQLVARPPTPIVQSAASGADAPIAPSATLPIYDGDPASPAPGQAWINRERGALRVALARSDAAPDAPLTILGLPLQSDSFVTQQYKINEYVNLVLSFALAFAVTFQTPIVVLLLGWSGLIPLAAFRANRKYALFICAAISAVVTPPDAISMISLGVPMYLLYELGVLLLQLLPAARVSRGLASAASPPGPSPGPDNDVA